MSRNPRFEDRFAVAWEPGLWQDVTVLVAVSGGTDSVALLRVMAAVKQPGEGRLVATHVNHQLRGAESEADEAFVVELCRQLQLPCDVGRVKVSPTLPASEAEARAARYGFLREAADRWGARYVATAHTADDQAETILHRILRGTGMAGLAGIPRTRPLSEATTVLRPLLAFRRQELAEYLQTLGQDCRHDSSNTDARFTRNQIRHQLLPDLAERFNSGIVDALLRLGTLAGEVQEVVAQDVVELADQCVIGPAGDSVRIRLSDLARQPRYLVRELLIWVWRQQQWPLQAMSFSRWDQLADLTLGAARERISKQVFPGGVVAEQCENELRLQRPDRSL